ncbi:MAG: hypothetical protein MJA83_05710 [Gammaproteobacteria bacterium]|nr:hypothetical protein [Gammaproteobacteria bacterium]
MERRHLIKAPDGTVFEGVAETSLKAEEQAAAKMVARGYDPSGEHSESIVADDPLPDDPRPPTRAEIVSAEKPVMLLTGKGNYPDPEPVEQQAGAVQTPQDDFHVFFGGLDDAGLAMVRLK